MRNNEQFLKVKLAGVGTVTKQEKKCCSCGKVIDGKQVYLCWPDGHVQHLGCWTDEDIDNAKKEKAKKA